MPAPSPKSPILQVLEHHHHLQVPAVEVVVGCQEQVVVHVLRLLQVLRELLLVSVARNQDLEGLWGYYFLLV